MKGESIEIRATKKLEKISEVLEGQAKSQNKPNLGLAAGRLRELIDLMVDEGLLKRTLIRRNFPVLLENIVRQEIARGLSINIRLEGFIQVPGLRERIRENFNESERTQIRTTTHHLVETNKIILLSSLAYLGEVELASLRSIGKSRIPIVAALRRSILPLSTD